MCGNEAKNKMRKPLWLNNKKANNKKGIFYLLLSSLFITVMIIVFLTYKEYTYTDQQKVTETRIMTINDFIRSIDTDSKRVIYISGFRSLIALEDYVAKSGNYLFNNTEELFRVAFYNGTVNGTIVDVLKDSTYSDYLNKLRVIAGVTGLDINITVPNITGITLYQESPWQVIVNVTVRVNLTDQKGLARWDFDKTYSANVSIISIRDPVYSVATNGLVFNPIRMRNITDITQGFVGPDNDTTNLTIHINNSYYAENNQSPSFLMRVKGDFSSSPCCGIESFVYLPRLSDQGLTINSSRSIIDYIYFSTNASITGYYNKTECNVQNMPSWFVIDARHVRPLIGPAQPDYIENLNYTDCP
jgi:hypothetical protein